MASNKIITLILTLIIAIAFSISCDRVLDPGESITIDTTGRGGAGIKVSPITGLITSENHDTAQFQVVLTNQPSENVMLPVETRNMKEGTLTVGTSYREQIILTFTNSDWNQPQTVTITGVDELDWNGASIQDGDTQYVVSLDEAISDDINYDGINPSNVLITNMDNDTPGVYILNEPRFSFTNENSQVINVWFKLRMMPNASVDIGPITSSDTTEGLITYPGSGSKITVSPESWNNPHSITVTGQPDLAPDTDSTAQTYTVDLGTIASADAAWNGLDAGSVDVVNHEYMPVTNYSYGFPPAVVFTSIAGAAGVQEVLFQINNFYNNPASGYTSQQNGFSIVDMGFDFNYLGMPFSDIIITTAGMASFSHVVFEYGYYGDNYALFSNYGIRYVLAPWWDDLDTSSGNVYYLTEGTAPNRTFIVEWNGVVQKSGTETYTFQLRLYEGSNAIQFVYGDKINGPSSTYSSSASIGISDGSAGIDGSGGSGNTNLTYDSFPSTGTVINFSVYSLLP